MHKQICTLLIITSLWDQCSGLGFILCSDHHFYIEETSNRLTAVEFGVTGVTRCKDFGYITSIQAFWAKLPINCVTKVSKQGMESIMKYCPRVLKDKLIPNILLDNLPKFRYNIFPGTQWCGVGNISESEMDIGVLTKLDMCCRTHDHCPDFISKGETKYGILNRDAGTISHCDCDKKFFGCLHEINHVESDNVGFTFGNVLAMPCFKKDFPIVKCLEYAGFFNKQCQRYELDTTKEPIYQVFDSKVYYTANLL